jgi:5-formyltetrahydrofolate cyclo-ligase
MDDGPPFPSKDAAREHVWDWLESSGEARFPFPPNDRIPNFAGADAAADRLAATPEWEAAATLKANPDAPQLPVRRAALRAGKRVYVARPRLRADRPFVALDPDSIADVDAATTVSGIGEYGRPAHAEGVDPVDLVVAGSVAVTTDGVRVGKGEGYSDLEWGLLSALDRLETATVATTVHEGQVFDPADLPAPDPHDVPLDLVVTPDRTIRTDTSHDRPTGIDWDRLDADRVADVPALARLREQREPDAAE